MNDITTWISSILGTVTATGVFTFLFAKSKYKVDVDKVKAEILQELENVKTTAIDNDVKLSAHYKEILDDLKVRYESRYKEFEGIMLRKVQLLEEENKLKDRKIKLQQQEISELKKENRILKKENANNNSTRASDNN